MSLWRGVRIRSPWPPHALLLGLPRPPSSFPTNGATAFTELRVNKQPLKNASTGAFFTRDMSLAISPLIQFTYLFWVFQSTLNTETIKLFWTIDRSCVSRRPGTISVDVGYLSSHSNGLRREVSAAEYILPSSSAPMCSEFYHIGLSPSGAFLHS